MFSWYEWIASLSISVKYECTAHPFLRLYKSLCNLCRSLGPITFYNGMACCKTDVSDFFGSIAVFLQKCLNFCMIVLFQLSSKTLSCIFWAGLHFVYKKNKGKILRRAQ